MNQAGYNYIGVGVGAIILNQAGEIFLAKRGPATRNERGYWEFPGGAVEFGETLQDAIKREIREEYGMQIEVQQLLGVYDHILVDEHQHWISITYLARYIEGIPHIREEEKCTAIGWFSLDNLPAPLSIITEKNLADYISI